MQKSNSVGICDILYDALRLISRCYAIIQRSALHAYYSALPFTPTKSHLFNKYHKDTIHNLCELGGVPEQWNASIANFIVDHARSGVLFSTDSSQLCCWTEQGLDLWDATSGTPVKSIK